MSFPLLLCPNISPSNLLNTLGTHIIPSPSEVDQIQSVISGAESDLCQLETDMAGVQAEWSHLYHRSEEPRAKIIAHKALLSPVRRLPTELLSEIFIHCLPDQRKMDGNHDSFQKKEAPLFLRFVCRRWRVVSLSTQKLWSFVRANFTTRTINKTAEQTNIWLERASVRPLSVTFYEEPGIPSIRLIDALVNLVLSTYLPPLSPHHGLCKA